MLAHPARSTITPRVLLIGLALLLGACATDHKQRVSDAAVTPLNDLNLVKTPIPEVLKRAKDGAYALADTRECKGLNEEIALLDAALGPDIDAPDEDKPDWLERGGDAAANAAVGALQRTAEGVVPFRSWVRKLSGAERQSRRVREAVIAGGLRRAFLKGVRVQLACPQQEAPQKQASQG